MRSHAFIVVPVITLSLALACGDGGSSQPPPPLPPAPDFALNVSPVSASAVVGNTSSAVTISFTSKNGFYEPAAPCL
jgi:hypothetical protein